MCEETSATLSPGRAPVKASPWRLPWIAPVFPARLRDDLNTAVETNEGNNCTVSTSGITVTP